MAENGIDIDINNKTRKGKIIEFVRKHPQCFKEQVIKYWY